MTKTGLEEERRLFLIELRAKQLSEMRDKAIIIRKAAENLSEQQRIALVREEQQK